MQQKVGIAICIFRNICRCNRYFVKKLFVLLKFEHIEMTFSPISFTTVNGLSPIETQECEL